MTRVPGVIGVCALALLAMPLGGCFAYPGEPSPGETPSADGTSQLPTPKPDEAVIIVTYGVDGDAVFASGIVPDRSGEEGRCTLVATSGDLERSAELEAGATPVAMNCGETRVTVSPGEWSLRLDYSAGGFTGHSGTVTVTVP